MNAYTQITTPNEQKLEAAFSDRIAALAPETPIPPLGADAYRDPTWIAAYQGENIYRLQAGFYWAMNAGVFWTIEDTRTAIDEYLDGREAPGFSAEYGL